MGDYTKTAYLLADLNKKIDEDFKKLSDKFDELKLSHNRKVRALQKILSFCNADFISSELIFKICDDALFCDGRCNCRPIVQRKKKGGAI